MTSAVRTLVVVVAAGLATASCTRPESPSLSGDAATARPDPYEPARPAPERGPGAFDHVAAVAVVGGTVVAGTPEGLAFLDATEATVRIVDETDGVSHRDVTAVAVGPEGTVWTAHRTGHGEDGTRSGGVRRFSSDGELLDAWLSEDGLGDADATCLAVADDGRAAACVDGAVAVLDPRAGTAWRRLLEGRRRLVEVVDVRHGVRREVVEHASPSERVLAATFAGRELVVGTTDGLLLRGGETWSRLLVPCRVGHRQPGHVVALAGRPDGSFVAVLGLARDGGGHSPGGVLEAWPLDPTAESDGPSWRHHCHEPGVDVPDALALDVATDGPRVLIASHAGLVRIDGRRIDLLDALSGAPDVPITAVAASPRETREAADEEGEPEADDRVAWLGTWGRGVARIEGDAWRLHELDDGSSSQPAITLGRVR